MSLGSIIKSKRKERKLTLDDLAAMVGFSKPYLSTIENSKVKNPPSDGLLSKLETALEVEQGLLLHIAHMESLPVDLKGHLESAQAENQRLKQLVKKIVNASDKDIKIEQLLSQNKLDMQAISNPASNRVIPVINKVSAGYPADFDDLDYPTGIADDYVRCPDINDPNAFAVHVVGDSMEPKFTAGDIVIFSPNSQVNNGDDCFVRFKEPHEATFKRVFFESKDSVRLQPRNDHYPPTFAEPSRINGIYRAVRKIQEL